MLGMTTAVAAMVTAACSPTFVNEADNNRRGGQWLLGTLALLILVIVIAGLVGFFVGRSRRRRPPDQ